jgi:hypothetical protein
VIGELLFYAFPFSFVMMRFKEDGRLPRQHVEQCGDDAGLFPLDMKQEYLGYEKRKNGCWAL